ncbi:MAG: hypothetical protein WBR15_06265, partial [Gammaproteobacteria bacterium]
SRKPAALQSNFAKSILRASLKIRDFGFWVGKNGRATGVYMPIHEDCEVIFNAARKQKINF